MSEVRVLLLAFCFAVASSFSGSDGACLGQAQVELTSDVRTWTNNTGKFSVKAKLLSVVDGTAKLEKSDGRVISLPANKLSRADRDFIEQLRAEAMAADNPFSGGERTPLTQKSGRSNRQNLRRVEIKAIKGRRSLHASKWKVSVEPSDAEVEPEQSLASFVALEGLESEHSFHDDWEPMAVSPGGEWAAASVTNPFEDKSTLSVARLKKPTLIRSATLPVEDLKVFAIDGDSQTVVTRIEESGRENGKLEFRSIENLQSPFMVWETADFHEREGFRPEVGHFIEEGKLLTLGENLALWDVDRAKPIYSFDLGFGRSKADGFAFNGGRRLMAVTADNSVHLIEVSSGKQLGTIDQGKSTSALCFSPSGEYLAGLEQNGHVWIWDLAANTLAQEFHSEARRKLAWTDERTLLGDNKYLIDIELRACVWQYETDHDDLVVPIGGGYFLLQRKDELIGLKLPHEDFTEQIADLDPDQLLLVKPGDEFAIDFDLPFGANQQQEIEDSLIERLSDQGFSVNDNSGLVIRGRVKRLEKKTVQVRNMMGLGRGRGESISFQANRSTVELLKDGKIIWTTSRYHGPPPVFHQQENESAQQYATRVSKPTPDLFLKFRIPAGLSTLPGGKPFGQSDITRGRP